MNDLDRTCAKSPPIVAGECAAQQRNPTAAQGAADFFHSVFDALPEHIAVLDRNGTIVAVNEAWRRFARENGGTGEDHGQIGVNYIGVCSSAACEQHNEEALSLQNGITEVLAGRSGGLTLEYPCHSPTEQRWFRVSVVPLDGPSTGVVVSHQNITALRQAEIQVRAREELFRDCIDHATDGLMVHGPGGIILEVNQRACESLGYTPEELIGNTPAMFNPEISADALADIGRRLRDGEIVCYESMSRRKDGSEFPVEIRIRGFAHQDRWRSISLSRDISAQKQAEQERTRLEAQLQQSQRLESVGRLAGGVAHDFNNMLGVMIGHAEMAMEHLASTDPLHMHLVQIRKACERSADLTRQLLAFARRQSVAPRSIDLNQRIEGMLSLLPRLLGENISLTWHPAADLWPVQMDPSQVDQIITNLCVNARDAITDVGTITLETANTIVTGEDAARNIDATPGDYVRISIADNGCGLDEATLAKIFEPFFTTKGVGKGTGLGLATVYGIVHQNHGFISVSSRPGAGSTFRIFIPRHDGPAETATVPKAVEAKGSGTAGILIVEDEPALLLLTSRMLRADGCRVFAALTPEEAVGLARDNANQIDLLLCDVVMPGMNGRELATRLTQQHPHIRCLFMSGYPGDFIANCGVLEDGVNFIEKPFSTRQLYDKVRSVLATEISRNA
jgi:PAS domain S-box-containing protein